MLLRPNFFIEFIEDTECRIPIKQIEIYKRTIKCFSPTFLRIHLKTQTNKVGTVCIASCREKLWTTPLIKNIWLICRESEPH